MPSGERFDVAVVGAGIGGLVAAARLQAAGLRVLVAEQAPEPGGRASTVGREGYLINTGAAFFEFGATVEQTLRLLGAPFPVRRPRRAVSLRIGGRTVPLDPIFGSRAQRALLGRLGRPLLQGPPAASPTVAEWLEARRAGPALRRPVRNLCASVFAVNDDELPAHVFFTYLTRASAFARFGICPQGSVGVARALVGAIKRHGGTVLTNAEVTALKVRAERVAALRIARPGAAAEEVPCAFAISNVGPRQTLALLDEVPDERAWQVRVESCQPCAMVTVNFATRRAVCGRAAAVLFAETDRLCGMAYFSATCPEMAPPGRHLYAAWAVPRPSCGARCEEAEADRALEELERQFHGLREAEIVSTAVMAGDWPAQRARAGADVPSRTPIANLWEVGDGAKPYGTGGTEGCAQSALVACRELLAAARTPRPVSATVPG